LQWHGLLKSNSRQAEGFTQSGNSYVLTNAGLTLQFDSYPFGYASAAR
jgi:hypothetical protein